MFQSLDDQFRECEVLQKDPSGILTNEKHRYVPRLQGDGFKKMAFKHSDYSSERLSLLVDC